MILSSNSDKTKSYFFSMKLHLKLQIENFFKSFVYIHFCVCYQKKYKSPVYLSTLNHEKFFFFMYYFSLTSSEYFFFQCKSEYWKSGFFRCIFQRFNFRSKSKTSASSSLYPEMSGLQTRSSRFWNSCDDAK